MKFMNSYTVLYAKSLRLWGMKSPTAFEAFDEFVMVNPRLDAEDMEEAFDKMQGEVWSPKGEAREFICAIGTEHTSMSVGDILIDNRTLNAYRVEGDGFKKIWDKSNIISLMNHLKNGYNEAQYAVESAYADKVYGA